MNGSLFTNVFKKKHYVVGIPNKSIVWLNLYRFTALQIMVVYSIKRFLSLQFIVCV